MSRSVHFFLNELLVLTRISKMMWLTPSPLLRHMCLARTYTYYKWPYDLELMKLRVVNGCLQLP